MKVKNWGLMIIVFVVFLTASYLLFYNYQNARFVYERTDEVITTHQLKKRLLTTMYNASETRSVLLLKMYIETDSFELDEMFMEMGEQARIFLHARQELFTLALTDRERELLAKQREVAMVNAPYQDQVAQLFIDEKRDEAGDLLFTQAIPGQRAMSKFIVLTMDEYEKETANIVENIRQNFEENNRIAMSLGALLALTSIAVIIIVMTRLSREEEKKLKAALREAEQASHAKSEFLSRMSHELRTPLHAIIAFSDLLLYEKNLEPKLKKHIQHIYNAGNHLLTLIDDVLDLARIESGKLSVTVKPIRLRQVLEECHSLIKQIAQDADVKLSFDTDVDYIVKADHTSLKQALLNILSNAVKYNRMHGAITVSYHIIDGDRLCINIIDTGKGLSTSQQQNLFKTFERLGAEFSGVKGTGIGLAITRDLIKMMGGRVGVESKEGEGSRFWIELELSDEPVEELAPVSVQRDEVYIERSISIVYVEDDPINAHLLTAIIDKMTRHELIIAATGADGLRLVREVRPDLIILDIGLPDMDGYELLREIRKDPECRDIPAIAVTANAMLDDVKRGEDAGFDQYMVKPVRASELLETIEQIIEQSD